MSDQAISRIDKDVRIAEREAALAARDTLIETLRLQLAQLKRMSFGQSSEKLITQIGQLELTLEELESEAEIADADKDGADQPDDVQPVRAAPVRRLPDHLPRIERRIEPKTGACTCPDCGGVLRPLGQASDEMLDVVPVQWRVIRTVRPNYTCRSCEKIVQAPAPMKAIARGKASFATLAHIVVNKFDHHLPLYRQAEMMAAQGIEIDRSTLAGWAGQAAELLDPIVNRIREEELKANMLKSRIHRRKPKGRPMSEHMARANAAKSAIRAKVEHIFAHQKNRYGLFIRTIGIARAEAKLTLANLAYNFDRLIFHQRSAATG